MSKKEKKEEVINFTTRIPLSIKKELKIRAAEKELSIQSLVLNLIKKELKKK